LDAGVRQWCQSGLAIGVGEAHIACPVLGVDYPNFAANGVKFYYGFVDGLMDMRAAQSVIHAA
jgi:hypothetical protein